MPTFRLDGAPGSAWFLFVPFGDDMEVRVHIEQTLKQERECVSGGFLEREHLDEVVADTEVPAVAFEMGLGQIVVEERVVLTCGEVEFQRIEVQSSLQNGESFVLPEDTCGNKIAHV